MRDPRLPPASDRSTDVVSIAAARMGRIVICVVGVVLAAAAVMYGYLSRPPSEPTVMAGFGIGFLLVWVGLGASNRFCARFGFELPWFIP